jgi:archaeal flagellar protein FlaH
MTTDRKKQNLVLTGVPEIDEKLGGGIPVRSLCLIEGQPDSGKSVLAQHLAYGSLVSGNVSVAYYTSENSIKSLIIQMDSLSLFTTDYFLTDKFRIYPLTLRQNIKGGKRFFKLLTEHLHALPPEFKLVIFDSITQFVAHNKAVDVIDFFQTCKNLSDEGRSVVLVAHHYAFEEEILARSRWVCDAHLRLRLEDIGDRMVKILEVLKVRGAERTTGEVVSFEIEPKAGMRIIPLNKAKV